MSAAVSRIKLHTRSAKTGAHIADILRMSSVSPRAFLILWFCNILGNIYLWPGPYLPSHFLLFNQSNSADSSLTGRFKCDSGCFFYFFEFKMLVINLFQTDMGSVLGIPSQGIKLLQLSYNIPKLTSENISLVRFRIWLLFFSSFYLLIADKKWVGAHMWKSGFSSPLAPGGTWGCTRVERFGSQRLNLWSHLAVLNTTTLKDLVVQAYESQLPGRQDHLKLKAHMHSLVTPCFKIKVKRWLML